MVKKNSKKHQQFYKMKGCSKTRKNHLGGSSDAPLAYTGKNNINYVPNPNLAYTGKNSFFGGSSSGLPQNINGKNPIYPNTGPAQPSSGTVFNTVMPQKGGSCSLCNASLMTGGGCGCGLFGMRGGKNKGFTIRGVNHRYLCKCSECKIRRKKHSMKGGNPGTVYAGGLTGAPYGPNQLPGSGISGDYNHYSLNTYSNGDPQTSMVNLGANRPFLNMKAGKKKQKGGTLSNFIGQDLINLGRQFQFGIGSAYNALAGYASPTNPMPWKGQFPVGAPMNPVKPTV